MTTTPEAKEVKSEVYDPFAFPPNIGLAQMHGRAFKIYTGALSEEKCPCCGYFLKGEIIPLCHEVPSLTKQLGTGYTLFFEFFQHCISLIALLLCISGIYNLVTNAMSKDCPESTTESDLFCIRDYVSILTIANKRDHLSRINTQLVLNLVATIVLILAFLKIRHIFRDIFYKFDEKNITPSDFTVRLDGVPSETTNEKLIEWMTGLGNRLLKPKVEKICRTYKISEFVRLYKRQEKLEMMIKTPKYLNNSTKIQTEIDEIKAKLNEIKSQKLEYGPVAFITFQTAKQAKFVRNELSDSTLFQEVIRRIFPSWITGKKKLGGNLIKASRAPEPTEILWENIGEPLGHKFWVRTAAIVATLVLIGFGFGLILLVQWGIVSALKKVEVDSPITSVLSFVSSIVIVIIDYLLSKLFVEISKWERNTTFPKYVTNVTLRITMVTQATLINSAFVTLITKFVLWKEYEEVTGIQRDIDYLNFYGPSGLLNNMFFVFISNAFLTPLMNYFDPYYIYRLWKQSKLKKNPASLNLNQQQTNELFEGRRIDLTHYYAGLLKTIFLICFYAPAMPIAIIFGLAGMLIQYWTWKVLFKRYLFLRKNALPPPMAHNLNVTMTDVLDWMALMFALGNLLFARTLEDNTGSSSLNKRSHALIWVTLAISIFHVFFPMEFVSKKLFSSKRTSRDNQDYRRARKSFKTDYDRENPITRRIALKYWLHEAFKVYYTPEEELDFNFLDLFARMEAVDVINIMKKLPFSNPARALKIEMLIGGFQNGNKAAIARTMAKIIIGKALPQAVYDEFDQMATQDTLKVPEEEAEQQSSASNYEVVIDVKNHGGNKVAPVMFVSKPTKEEKDDKSSPRSVTQEKSEIIAFNKQAELYSRISQQFVFYFIFMGTFALYFE